MSLRDETAPKVEEGVGVATPDQNQAVKVHASFAVLAVREQLRRHGVSTVGISGRSMWPLLREGQLVRLRPVGADESLHGLVVAVASSGMLVVHRVVCARGGEVVVKGVNCATPDRPLPRSQVLGVVFAIGRHTRPQGAAVVARLAGAAEALLWIRKRVHSGTRKRLRSLARSVNAPRST